MASVAASASAKKVAPSAERNKDAILGVLRPRLEALLAANSGTDSKSGSGTDDSTKATTKAATTVAPVLRVLEVASGTGQHAYHMATSMPFVYWQPSEYNVDAFPSINAYRADCDRMAEPFQLDVLADPWKVPAPPTGFTVKWPPFDALLNCNMLHLAPEACVEALFKGAAAVIRPQGFMAVYGPFTVDGKPTTESNAKFDLWCKQKDASYGVRDVDAMRTASEKHGFVLEEKLDMPANNLTLIFRRQDDAADDDSTAATTT